MSNFKQKIRPHLISLSHWAERYRWVLFVVIGFLLFLTEYFEFVQLQYLNQPLHIGELFLYSVLIIGTCLFLELYVRSNKAYKKTLKVLDYKHQLSLNLILNNNWKALITRLAELPATITEADESYFLLSNPISGKLEVEGHWGGGAQELLGKWDPTIPCSKCFEIAASRKNVIHLCQDDRAAPPYSVYSLAITGKDLLIGVLKFKLKPGLRLSDDVQELFNNIGDEIAVAVHASQTSKRLSELQSFEVAMAERRMVSAFVHDQLGQNLGYLHMKLDQLVTGDKLDGLNGTRKELTHLREVSNDSYEIVRDLLKKMQPETIPHLTNLLKEHAMGVSHSANFTLNFESTGNPIKLLPEAQQTIFYVFREIFNNVERHSKASKVDVLVSWREAFLDVSVADNGVGFVPELVQKEEHFGLEIMQERIARLKGQLLMNSSADAGTVISISVPI